MVNLHHQAIKSYKIANRLNETYETHYQMGNIHIQMEQLDKAFESFKNCLRFDPNSISTLLRIAFIHENYETGNLLTATDIL
jgi:tetratricopeptide (TPR) repeat protein